MRKWDPCIIVWRDAVTVYSPSNSKSDFSLAERRTIGFLIRRTPDSVTIAMEDDRSSHDDDDCQTVTSIPTGMIIAVVPLNERTKRR